MFFFKNTATPEIYTLSLHDALPIFRRRAVLEHDLALHRVRLAAAARHQGQDQGQDRKSTRLNSSHLGISYAVFCLKKKKQHCPSRIDDCRGEERTPAHCCLNQLLSS